jgi:hypothetical protein
LCNALATHLSRNVTHEMSAQVVEIVYFGKRKAHRVLDERGMIQ